ncbi:MAG: MFS transporter [Chloroflexi bacterium]|nr:MFS transporter [Chloroflexota bacterium]
MQQSEQPDKRWQIPFFSIWFGQTFSLLGSSLVQFALVWWLTRETGSATVLATASLVAMLPQIFLGPLAGAYVDRWNRRRTMIVADTGIALATVWLVVLFSMGWVQVWHIYVIMLIRSLGGAFHWPAMQASTSLMVPPEHLSRIAGLNQSMQGAISIVAPPVGALLLEALPMAQVLAIDIVTAALAVTPLLFVMIPQPARSAPVGDSSKPSIWADLRSGLRYVRGWPGLMIIMVMATMINFLFSPAFALLPLLVKDHFGGGALELGWTEAAWGIGVIAGGLALGVWGGFKRKLVTSMLGLIGMGIGSVMVGVLPGSLFGVALAAMLLLGFMNPITNGPLFAVLQASVAPEMQGRVFTLLTSAATAMSPLSLALAGPLADELGIQLWYIVAGVFCGAMGVLGFFIPALVNMEKNNGAAQMVDGGTPALAPEA